MDIVRITDICVAASYVLVFGQVRTDIVDAAMLWRNTNPNMP